VQNLWRMVSCYQPSRKTRHNAFTHYTFLKMLNVFNICPAE